MAAVSAATSEYKIQSVQLLCYQTNTVTKRADTFSNKNYTSMQNIKDFFFLFYCLIEIFVSLYRFPFGSLTGCLLLLLVVVIVFFWRHVYLLGLKLISFFLYKIKFSFFVGVIKKVDNNILECVQLHPNKRLLLFLCFLFF